MEQLNLFSGKEIISKKVPGRPSQISEEQGFCRKLSALVQYFQNQLSLDTVMLLLHKTDPKLSSFQH